MKKATELVKVGELTKLSNTPSKEAVYRVFRRPVKEWPPFAHLTNNGRKAIDVSDPSWEKYLARRSFNRKVGDKSSSSRHKILRQKNKQSSSHFLSSQEN